MTDLTDLLQSREQLARRLEKIEAALTELERNAARVDAGAGRLFNRFYIGD